jgi:hypothetical protein
MGRGKPTKEERKKANTLMSLGLKHCNICNQDKSITEFYIVFSQRTLFGLSNCCSSCKKEAMRVYNSEVRKNLLTHKKIRNEKNKNNNS